MYKVVLILMVMLCLSGCSHSNSLYDPLVVKTNSLYKDLSGLQTYQEAVEYFNKHVCSYEKTTRQGMKKEVYQFCQKDELKTALLDVYNDHGQQTLSYIITTPTGMHVLYLDQDNTYTYEYDQNQCNEGRLSPYYDRYESDYEILNVTRQDVDNRIYLKIEAASFLSYQSSDMNVKNYLLHEVMIDSSGMICNEKMTYYADENFKESISQTKEVTYSRINEIDDFDIEEKIDLIKSCDQCDEQDVYKRIGM